MSFTPASEPVSSTSANSGIAVIVDARPRDVGGFKVRRLLPSRACRLVGPFIFLDHMGPIKLAPGRGIDVLPHPHIGLATVTYLLDGELIHRDSLGSHQQIRAAEINWMTAGCGIVHSERTSPELQQTGSSFHGLQLWVALPKAGEEIEPSFQHYEDGELPKIEENGAGIRVLIGKAYGVESQVQTLSPAFLIDLVMQPESELPLSDLYQERAVYVIDGVAECCGERAEAGRMLVVAPGVQAVLRAESAARIVLLGGAAIDGPRHIWWNFVSSSKERIEQAKRDWKERRFPKVPGDEGDFTPLPTYS